MNQSFAKFLLALRNTKNDHFEPEFPVMAREYQKKLHICFIDYSKAFDCVNHDSLCYDRWVFRHTLSYH